MRDKETYTWNAVANYRTATVQSRDCEAEADPQKSKAKTTRTWTTTRSRRLPLIGLKALPLSAHRVVI